MCDCDFELPTVYSELFPKSKKVRKCCECGSEIQVGEKYQNVFGVWSGDASTYSTCMFCFELRKIVGGCVAFTELRDAVIESGWIGRNRNV